MSTPTSQTTTLYANDPDGRISCIAHVGNYATAAIAARPNADEWDTPLGTWYVMTADDIEQFTAAGLTAACECCQFEATPAPFTLTLVK